MHRTGKEGIDQSLHSRICEHTPSSTLQDSPHVCKTDKDTDLNRNMFTSQKILAEKRTEEMSYLLCSPAKSRSLMQLACPWSCKLGSINKRAAGNFRAQTVKFFLQIRIAELPVKERHSHLQCWCSCISTTTSLIPHQREPDSHFASPTSLRGTQNCKTRQSERQSICLWCPSLLSQACLSEDVSHPTAITASYIWFHVIACPS